MNRNSILRIEFTSIKVTQRLFESRVKLKQKNLVVVSSCKNLKAKSKKRCKIMHKKRLVLENSGNTN